MEQNTLTKTEKKQEIYTREQAIEASLKYFNGDSLAAEVWVNKYALKDSNENIFELTPDDMHKRIAREFARAESKFENPLSEEEIYSLIKDFKYLVPQGSPMAGIGNDFQYVSLSNCFVIGNDKDSDSYGGILKLDQELVQLMKRRAGVGLDLSFVRPKGTPVKNSALTSTGVVPFMERFSNSTREVAQDGRRGALMESISIVHPDSEAFIDAKMDEKKVTGANVSVRVSDDFMKAALSENKFTQKYPIDSNTPKYTKEIEASPLWKKVIHNAWKRAEPGVLFWDTIIRESIPDCYADLGFKTTSTNPCIPGDTWILTDCGPRQVKDLLGKQFNAIVDGVMSPSTAEGFFLTGHKKVYEVKTKRGYSIRATHNHELERVVDISRDKKHTEWCEVKYLNVGDKINISNNRENNWKGFGNSEQGWLIGNLIGDGTFDSKRAIFEYWGDNRNEMKEYAISLIKNNFKHRNDLGSGDNLFNEEIMHKVRIGSSEVFKLAKELEVVNKHISEKIEKTSSNFQIGFISGIFDADGTVNDNLEKGINVRLASSDLNNLYSIQRMLSRFGIISSVYENRRTGGFKAMPNGKGGQKDYFVNAQHELIISKDNVDIFNQVIGFKDEVKSKKLNEAISNLNLRGLYRERFCDEIESIVEAGYEDVYDCQITGINKFEANGIVTHNCGEITLCPNDSCRLLILNLYSYVENPFTDKAKFNFELFKKHVVIAQRLMDDLIELELEKIDKILGKINSDPEEEEIKRAEIKLWTNIKNKCIQGRRTGLGVTAEGDMMAALGIIYGTDEGNKFAEKVHKNLKLAAYASSVELAKERGAFPIYDWEKEKNNPFILRIKKEDAELYENMVKYGRRNIALLTIAPTGSVSILTQTTSGIEPAFMIMYMRRRKINPNDKNARVDFTDSVGDSWQEYPVFHHKFLVYLEANGYNVNEVINMPKEDIEKIIKKSPYYKATSNDVDWVKKVEMQGMVQKHVDHSISVTVNLPEDISEETVAKVYETGWRSGCKGVTVYREGSRSGVLVSETEKKEKQKEKMFEDSHAPKRPKFLDADVHRFTNKGEKWIAFVGLFEGRPYEIFTGREDEFKIPKSIENGVIRRLKIDGESRYDFIINHKTDDVMIIEGLSKAFNHDYHNYAKMISGILRHGMPLPYVINLVESLNLGEEALTTWKAGVVRGIKKYISEGTKLKGANCTNCGAEDSIIFSEGCLKCASCGTSKCG
jgi:ribonucleotide reductase alpha subunit